MDKTDIYHEKIAKILRVPKNDFVKINSVLQKITGKNKVIEKIFAENEVLIRRSLDVLGLGRNVPAFEVYDALISKIESDDFKLFDALGGPNLNDPEDVKKILDLVHRVSDGRTGFFLKRSVAIKMLEAEPPKKILKALGYKNVGKMLENEDWLEIFAALRFLEDPKWLNEVFFKQYEKLMPDDFEERKITSKVLSDKWVKVAEKFVRKKYHNLSHLKELGFIFVIPISLNISGETIRLVSLLSHYYQEIYFYSSLFKECAKYEDIFAQNVVSLLKGYVEESKLPRMPVGDGKLIFLILQQYLAKSDENDWRLLVPHINPEAVHWKNAEDAIFKIEESLPKLKDSLCFWQGLGWVGDYFKDEAGKEILISFNLVDTAMSLVQTKEMTEYLYHHQEALWNKIFAGYFGEKKMNEMLKKFITKGWFEV